MSLYNMLFGTNALAGVVLQALGTSADDVPRFRDAYYDAQADRLVIHTRTGGGNRDFYECEARCRDNYPESFSGEGDPSGPWNSDLRALPGFIYDEDDDFDSTYADWHYEVPAAFRPIFDGLKEIGAGNDAKPAERWQATLEALRTGANTPDTARALAVGEEIFGKITASLAAQG